MNQEINKEDVFFQDGYKLVKELPEKITKDMLFSALEQMYASIDMLIDSILLAAKKHSIQVHCFKGCEYCCHQPVFANSYETHYLSEHIKTFLPADVQDIYRLSCEKDQQVQSLSESEMLSYKSPCPLLKQGVCSAYQARPMACRIYLSMQLKSCLEFYFNPTSETSFPTLLDFPLQAGRMMNEGFSAALMEKGIPSAEFRLEKGLSICLDSHFVQPF